MHWQWTQCNGSGSWYVNTTKIALQYRKKFTLCQITLRLVPVFCDNRRRVGEVINFLWYEFLFNNLNWMTCKSKLFQNIPHVENKISWRNNYMHGEILYRNMFYFIIIILKNIRNRGKIEGKSRCNGNYS